MSLFMQMYYSALLVIIKVFKFVELNSTSNNKQYKKLYRLNLQMINVTSCNKAVLCANWLFTMYIKSHISW